MQQMTKEEVKKIQAMTGHVITVDDLDLIERLDSVAIEVSAVTKRERRLLSQPLDLCGVKFYPITVAKTLWYKEKCEEWDVSDTASEGFLIWLITLPNTADALDAYTEYKHAEKAARKLSRKLTCSPEELADVYGRCIGRTGCSDDSDGADEVSDVDYGGIIAVLLREYGGTPDMWLYETTSEYIGDLMESYENG